MRLVTPRPFATVVAVAGHAADEGVDGVGAHEDELLPLDFLPARTVKTALGGLAMARP